MPVPRPSEQEVLGRIYNRIRNETPITAALDSSMIGVILKVIAAEMDLVWQYIEDLYQQSNLSTATGASLDNFGLLFGVPRKAATQASTAGYTRAVRFFNTGSITVTVPSGTRVYKDSDPTVAYFTTEGAAIAPGSSQDLHVTAANPGEVYNVGIGELNRHSLPSVSVTVTNILPIQNGALEESDASYRERILQELTRRDSLNVFNTDAMLRQIPGIRDVFILDFKRGAGTFDAVIIPYNQSDTQQVVSEAQRLLDDNVPAGISAIARPPQYRQLDVSITLQFSPDAGNQREQARESIRSQIIARVDNLPVEDGSGNGTFYPAQITALATLADPTILGVVASLGLDGSPLAPVGSITLAIGERLVLRSLSVQ